MVLRGLEDGAEVKGVHAQLLEILQLVEHTQQAAAEEIPVADLSTLVREVLGLLIPAGVDMPPPHQTGGVGDVETAEPVGENLIGHALPEPGGHDLGVVVNGELIFAQLGPAAVQALHTDGVPDQAHILPGLQRAGETVPLALQARPGQGTGESLVPTALKPGGEGHAGEAPRPQRADGEADRSPRRDRSIRGFAGGVPRVEGAGVRHNAISPILQVYRPAPS